MSDDPYKTLGVSSTASQDEIRKAYRKLAKKLHPDLKPGDKDAEGEFKKVAAAYQLLNDPETRARYDRGEIDASGAERPQQRFYREYAEADPGHRYSSSSGFGDFEDVSDLFSDFFGGARGAARGGAQFRSRGADARYHLEIDFLDAVNGATRRITLPDGSSLNVTIPAGVRDGGTLRLRGKGGAGIGGGPPGDALVDIAVRPHPVFQRDGNDIVVELPITLDEAVLGARIEVPTISGRVSMTVPKGANTGDVLRLRGKGIRPARGEPGDQRVVLKLMLPDKIDGELEAFIADWRERHGYDPRAKLRSAT